MLQALLSSTRTARRRRAASLLASLLLVSVAAAASAQSIFVTPNDQRPSSGWTVTPVFVFSQSADSNVTLAGKGAPNTADKALGLAPSGEIGYLGPHTTMTAGYAGSATRYFTLSQLDTFDQRLYVNFKQLITRRVQLFGQASAGWLPTTDTVLLAGVPFVRVGSTIKTVQGGVTVALAKHTTTTAGYRLEYIGFDRTNPLAVGLLGGHSNGVYGDIRQQVSPHVTVGAAYDIRRTDITDRLQQFNMLNVQGTVEYRFSPAFFVSGGLGVARIAGSLPGFGSRVGPAMTATINYTFDRTLAFAGYTRAYVPSYAIGGTTQDAELTTGVRVPVAFRNRLVLGGSVSWRRNDPLSLLGQPLNSVWLTANAGYGFAPWLRVEGFYSRSTQDSHLPGGVVDRNQFGVQIVTLAPMRFK
ncbi:MAG: hypothetical protein ACM3NQ_12270 [Bacteroidales bacterium]